MKYFLINLVLFVFPLCVFAQHDVCHDSECTHEHSESVHHHFLDSKVHVDINVLLKKLDGFRETSRMIGYQSPEVFANFVEKGEVDSSKKISEMFKDQSLIWIIIMILLGGFALNLSPCVLPMIPINTMIITGMNVQERAHNRWRGAILGGTYGLAMVVTYAVVGILVLLAGMRIGLLNSSPIFYFVIAVFFFFLALAMMGKFGLHLDLSGLGHKVSNMRGGKLSAVFCLGAFAAIHAGACVAPIITGVFVFSAERYGQGDFFGLFYPMLLGVGMGVPWIAIGAGLSFLPKTGAWMNQVKNVFAVLILAMGIYYLYCGYELLQGNSEHVHAVSNVVILDAAVAESTKENKTILVSFSASWCASCNKMESSTFMDPRVKKVMRDVIHVAFDGSDLKSEDVEPILNYFNVQGFPTYLLLVPKVKP